MKNKWIFIIGMIVGLGVAIGLAIPQLTPHNFSGTLLQSPSDAHDFALMSHTGQRASLSDFRGKLVVLYFGYTFCPDVCPSTLSEIAGALEILGEDADQVQTIMITVDPERDTVDLLADYIVHFDPGFLGLTGSAEEIAEVATLYGIYYGKNEGSEATDYLIDHTASQIVIDEEGHVKLVFPFGTSAENIAADLEYLLKH